MSDAAHSVDRLRQDNAALRQRIAELEARPTRVEFSPATAPHIDALLHNLPGMVYRCRNDSDWTMDYVSAGAQELTGFLPEDLRQGRVTYASIILSEDRGQVWEEIQAALSARQRFELVYRIRGADGTLKWVWERGWGIWLDSGELLALEGFITDITRHKDVELALRESEHNYRRIVEGGQEGIWTLDGESRTTFVNPRMAEMLGYGVQEMLGKPLLDFMSEEWQAIALSKVQERRQDVIERHDFKFRRKDGSEIWTLLSTNPILDEAGHYSGTLAMAVDITDRKQIEASLQELAISDPLTGLLNRRRFYDLAQQELERFKRYGCPMAAIMADLDHFKAINDQYGHLIGDQVLQGVARMLRENLRQPDLLCRYGGEEFAILLPETDLHTASMTAERLRSTLDSHPIETDQGPLHLTISLGAATVGPGSAISVETLLDDADRMLYVAKHAGRNQVAIWDLASNRKMLTEPSSTPASAEVRTLWPRHCGER